MSPMTSRRSVFYTDKVGLTTRIDFEPEIDLLTFSTETPAAGMERQFTITLEEWQSAERMLDIACPETVELEAMSVGYIDGVTVRLELKKDLLSYLETHFDRTNDETMPVSEMWEVLHRALRDI